MSDQAIYDSYRNQLRALRKAGPHRSGARKQLALKRVADSRNIPVSQVKLIVKTFDEKNGVTHEHDVNYFRELEFLEKAAKLMGEHGDGDPCPRCGELGDEDGNLVRVRVDPTKPGELEPLLTCFMCYLRSQGKI